MAADTVGRFVGKPGRVGNEGLALSDSAFDRITDSAAIPALCGAAQGTLNPDGEARYGRQDLSPGFSPAPVTLAALSGGSIDVKSLRLGDNCLGFAAADPDFVVDLSGAFDRITILIASASDTTLIVNMPNGGWTCNDDTNGLNPALVFHNAPAGAYQIWIGSYAAEAFDEAVLYVSEDGPESLPTTATGPDPALDPHYGVVTLAPGFQPSPYTIQLIGGGRSQIADDVAGEHCRGYVSEAPDISVVLSESMGSVWFGVTSPADMALLIYAADGNWHCSDDNIGSDPLIGFDYALAGLYGIWVGSADEDNYAATIFYVTESSPENGLNLTIDTSCPGLLSTDLGVGSRAIVSPSQTAGNPIHSSPETATTVIYRAAPGSTMLLIGGPVCGDAHRWWRAELGDGGRGWIADGDRATRWLELHD